MRYSRGIRRSCEPGIRYPAGVRVEPLTYGPWATYKFGDLTCCEDLHRRLSDISHVGLGCVSPRTPPSGKTLSPLSRCSPVFTPSVKPQAPGSGIRNSLFWLWFSSSDPRRTLFIVNQGIRKSEKIRKIGKAWSIVPLRITPTPHTIIRRTTVGGARLAKQSALES